VDAEEPIKSGAWRVLEGEFGHLKFF